MSVFLYANYTSRGTILLVSHWTKTYKKLPQSSIHVFEACLWSKVEDLAGSVAT